MRIAERERGVVEARRAAAGGRLLRRFRRQLQRRQRRVLADVLRDELIERGGHARAGGGLVRTSPTQPRGRGQTVDPASHGLVLQVPERGDIALVRLERGEDRAQREVGTRAARRPPVHLRAVRGVAHDRAVRDVEESHAHLRGRGGLRQRSRRRDHGIEQRQGQGDPGAFQHGSPGQVFFRQEHDQSFSTTVALAEVSGRRPRLRRLGGVGVSVH